MAKMSALLWGAMLAALVGPAAAVDLPPPGDCTPEQHRALQDDVDAKCSVPRRCDRTQDCATLQSNYDKLLACASARDTINVTCFRGGNPTHREAADNERRGAQRCSMIMVSKKCTDCP
jgi:hypothetical protein